MKRYIDWRVFSLLLAAGLLSVVCVFPYVLTVQGGLLKTIGQPIEIIFFAQLIQSFIMFSITVYLGLVFIKTTGFQLPLIEAYFKKSNYKIILQGILGKSALIGAATAVIIYVLDSLFTLLGSGITTHQSIAPAWQKLLAALYGGVTEEILMRLFLMSLFIWIGMKIFRHKKPTIAGIAVANILAAILFGLGHLPITASLTQITPLVIARAIILNGIGGIIFGWLFWKKGLESAMIAHFMTDVFLLTLLPLIF